MKKIIALLLSTLTLFTACTFFASAKQTENISAIFNTDIGGLSYADYDKLCEITSDEIVFNTVSPAPPVFVADYAGNVYLYEMKPGRTYYIEYSFIAADGYELPEKVGIEDFKADYSGICDIYWCGIKTGNDNNGNIRNSLSVNAKVTADGTFIQRLIGRIADIILKLRAWSLY